MTHTDDVIDRLAGIRPGSPLDAWRAQRPLARSNAQQSYLALFEPVQAGAFDRAQRHAIAAFVAGLHGDTALADFYANGAEWPAEILAEAGTAATQGPYGSYPPGPLSGEDLDGPDYRVGPEPRTRFGERLAVALEHAHLLVFHPRDASAGALQALREAGWSIAEIVTLSQLVSFLSFQIRVIHGLRVLAANPGAPA